MIEVIIDFSEITFEPYKNKEKYNHIPNTIEATLLLYLCRKLNIAGVFGWDAFKDNIYRLRFEEIPKDYVYNPNDKYEWESYEEYKSILYEDRTYGPKNKDGIRDDLKLTFVNFQQFFIKHRSIACKLLEFFFEFIEETKKLDEGDLLAMDIYIKS